jgi:hypothetical protein
MDYIDKNVLSVVCLHLQTTEVVALASTCRRLRALLKKQRLYLKSKYAYSDDLLHLALRDRDYSMAELAVRREEKKDTGVRQWYMLPMSGNFTIEDCRRARWLYKEHGKIVIGLVKDRISDHGIAWLLSRGFAPAQK